MWLRLRAMVVYDESCSPKLASHDRRYYETTMASNDSTAVVGLTNSRHGPATIIQTLKELRETQYCGAPVTTTVKNIYTCKRRTCTGRRYKPGSPN